MEWRANRVAPKIKHTNPHRAAAFVPNMHSIWQHIKHGALLIEIIFLICAPMDTPKARDSLFDIAQVVTDTAASAFRQKPFTHKKISIFRF
jgi:hypothetical protein